MTDRDIISLEPVTDPHTGRVVYQDPYAADDGHRARQSPQIIGGDLVPGASPNHHADSVTLTDDKFAALSRAT